MKTTWMLGVLGAIAAAAPMSYAGQCDGKPGWSLEAPDTAPIGSTVDIEAYGPANALGFFMVSLSQGAINTSYGTICVGFPLALGFPFVVDANGEFEFSGDLPCDPALVNLQIYLQFITCSSKEDHGASNLHTLTITDGVCDGDMCSVTQGGWGSDCHGGNPGCRRDKYFDSVFPSGVILGDHDGIDGDGDFALLFDSSDAVNAFLPAGGTADVLDADATDPTDSAAGVLAGQLLAAKLNVGFDAAGAMDDCKGRTDLKLGDLVLKGGADPDLLGMKVSDLIDLADAVISGALGAGPYDLNGDGTDDVTISDISDALTTVNENFDNGGNNGNLGI